MLILSCNVGSTSLKFKLFDMSGETVLASGHFEGIGRDSGKGKMQAEERLHTEDSPRPNYGEAIGAMLDFLNKAGLAKLDCVAFKVVAALGVSGVVELTEDVLAAMEAYNGILPAHNPPYIAAIRQFKAVMPGVPLIGSFETGFFRRMPKKAYLYPVPAALLERGVRKNGAHGASHEYIAGWVTKKEGREDVKLISCHLGGSSSMAAIVGMTGLDTTLGLSLQSGLPHNNRIGDADPCLSMYLTQSLGYTEKQVEELFTRQSGLLGMSGVSGELWQIQEAALQGNQQAQDALDMYCYQIKKYIGAFAAALEGLDVIAFTGGIGQNSVLVRSRSLSGLGFLGIKLDEEVNQSAKPPCLISAPDSRVRVYVVATDEEIVIARKARDYLRDPTV